VLEPGYIYIRISNFQTKTTGDFKDSLKNLTKDGAISGLIIDLRNNPGGLLNQSVNISDVFINEGVIVSTKGRVKEQNTIYNATSSGPEYNFPMVVLVNEGSASASEIVAGALQDHKKALIVGTQTFGKGSVQTIIPMSNGAGLRLTTARYYTPGGRSIQAKGIEPDIIVERIMPPIDDKDNKKTRTYMRESDLKNYIENGNTMHDEEQNPEKEAPQTGEDKNIEIEKNITEKAKGEAEEIKELLVRDNQLRTALMLLKGLNVYSGFIPPVQKK
jgi:carboxyl-terminal processing protease